jgi:hypothetical protein
MIAVQEKVIYRDARKAVTVFPRLMIRNARHTVGYATNHTGTNDMHLYALNAERNGDKMGSHKSGDKSRGSSGGKHAKGKDKTEESRSNRVTGKRPPIERQQPASNQREPENIREAYDEWLKKKDK